MFHPPDPAIAEPVGKPDSDPAAFLVPSQSDPIESLFVLAGHIRGFEYVQVTGRERCPTWDEMCQIKSMFWDAEDVCFQLHPARSRYVNKSEFSLWIWRPTDCEIPQPPLHHETINHQKELS